MTKSLNIVHQAILSKLVRTWAAGHHHHQGDGEIDARRLVDASSRPGRVTTLKGRSQSGKELRFLGNSSIGIFYEKHIDDKILGNTSIGNISGKHVKWEILEKTERWKDFQEIQRWEDFREIQL